MSDKATTDPLVVLEVLGGPLDGLAFEGHQSLVRIGRSEGAGKDGVPNDVVLQRDNYSSGFHMHVYHEDGKWWVKDIGSTNGSWTAKGKMEPNVPEELKIGGHFVAGNSVIRFTQTARGLPETDPNAINMLSPASQTVLIRARKLARDQKVAWLSPSVVFSVLSETEAPQLAEFFGQSGLDPQQATLTVKGWERWTGELAWIERDDSRTRGMQRMKTSAALPTPRLHTIATLANLAREKWGATQVEPIHLMYAIFQEGNNRVVKALAETGFAADVLMQLIDDMLTASAEPQESTAERERTMAIAPLASAPEVPRRKPVDAETWLLARAMMDKVQAAQSDYRLAEPAVRFEALCAAIREGVQKCAPPKREALLETMYYLFPVLEDALVQPPPALENMGRSTEAGETTDGRGIEDTPENVTMIDEDEAPTPSRGESSMDTGELLQKVFGSERMATMAGQPAEENQILALMKCLYGFALDIERLAKGMVQSVQGGSAGESRYFLPFTVHDLKVMSEKLVEQGDPQTVAQLDEYLDDLGRWLIALIAAHQKASSEWNKELWEKINPAAIKDEAKMSALNKAIGGGASELWKTYERISRDLDPDVTDDMLTQKIGRMANEEFRRLSAK